VPKIYQEYQKRTEKIKTRRNPGSFENGCFIVEIPYFLRLGFFRCFLHTVEVTGSSPVSPTMPYPETPTFFGAPPNWLGGVGVVNMIKKESWRRFGLL
jgi:hypothetical protein